MIALLGHFAVVLAFLVALFGALMSFAGARLRQPAMLLSGRRAAFTVAGLVSAAVALMLVALIRHDFSVKYVADVGSTTTPLYYTITSLWSALEGSILLWAFLLSLYTTLFLVIYRHRFDQIRPYITGMLLVISAFFLFVVAWPGNPFAQVPPVPSPGCPPTGCGANPLLQNNPFVGLHPPLLYLGYVGLSVPYAIAMASLVVGTPTPDTLRLIRRWALIPWVFLSLGIVAGMWWSYTVLGWGGYWSWDPVENASVMPWLITTAFLHSLQVQERRQMLKTWTLSLIIAAFLLSILGTFLTRSGVLASVHSFTQSAIGPVFLVFLAAVLIGSLGLLFARSAQLGAPGALDAAICRESAFMFNNLLLVGLTFTILLGTLFPLVAEALQGTQLSVGAPYFNHVAVPIGVALLFLMGVGPALPWGMARLEELQYRLLAPVAVGVGVVFVLMLAGVRGLGALVTFGLAGFVLAVTLERVVADVRKRRHSTDEGWLTASRALFRAAPRRYGGYLVHVGVLLIIVGIAASQEYGARATATLYPGQSMSVAGYTLTYQTLDPRRESNRMVLGARIAASRGGRSLGTLVPSQNYYQTLQQPVVTPAVNEQPWDMVYGIVQGRNPLPDLAPIVHGQNPFEDLYLVLQAVDTGNASRHRANRWITLQALVNPMVDLIWLGGFVMGLGGFFALLPARRRKTMTARVPEPVVLQPEEVTA